VTNTNTDTPHLPPPPPAPDTAALNAQIATLRGWTCQNVETRYPVPLREQKSPMDRLTPPIKHERWFPPGEHYDLPLPDYAGDPAAAFGLLDHVLGIGFEVTSLNKSIVDFEYEIRLVGMAGHQRIHPYAHAATLPLAIARACRDALLAIKGETDNGTA